MIRIVEIKDTDDGGAILSLEVSQEMLHTVFSAFVMTAIQDKVNEAIFEDLCAKDYAREVASEDGGAPKTNQAEKGPVGFCDADGCTEQQFWDDRANHDKAWDEYRENFATTKDE